MLGSVGRCWNRLLSAQCALRELCRARCLSSRVLLSVPNYICLGSSFHAPGLAPYKHFSRKGTTHVPQSRVYYDWVPSIPLFTKWVLEAHVLLPLRTRCLHCSVPSHPPPKLKAKSALFSDPTLVKHHLTQLRIFSSDSCRRHCRPGPRLLAARCGAAGPPPPDPRWRAGTTILTVPWGPKRGIRP